ALWSRRLAYPSPVNQQILTHTSSVNLARKRQTVVHPASPSRMQFRPRRKCLATPQNLQWFDRALKAAPTPSDGNPLVISVDASEFFRMRDLDGNETIGDNALLPEIMAVGKSGNHGRHHRRVPVSMARERLNRTHQLRFLRRRNRGPVAD